MTTDLQSSKRFIRNAGQLPKDHQGFFAIRLYVHVYCKFSSPWVDVMLTGMPNFDVISRLFVFHLGHSSLVVPIKMLKIDICITVISQALLEIFYFKVDIPRKTSRIRISLKVNIKNGEQWNS